MTPGPGGPGPTAGFRVLEHTADLGLAAWGATPAEAFTAAAYGMFAVMLGTDPREAAPGAEPEVLTLQVDGRDWEELLVNWLAELLYCFEVEGFVPVMIAIEQCEPPRCAARLQGFRPPPGEPAGGMAIKAVTYHQLVVEQTAGRTELRVIFDI